VTPPGIFSPSLDPRPGTTAGIVPILSILEIVGRYKYMYRYNIRPRVVTPLSVYVLCNFNTFRNPRQLHSNHYP
jgi:hypothetical protein